jgi:hypothetical protein
MKKNKIINLFYNPWVVGASFYLLGLLTPNTINTLKKITYVHVDGDYYEGVNSNLDIFLFVFFLFVLVFVSIILISNIFDD